MDRSFEKRGVRLLFFRTGGTTVEIGSATTRPPDPEAPDRFGGLAWKVASAEAARTRLAGAGLDVFESEAMSADYPLLQLDNVVLSPHLAGSAEECLERAAVEVAEQVIDVLQGRRPPNLVNPEVWDRLAPAAS